MKANSCFIFLYVLTLPILDDSYIKNFDYYFKNTRLVNISSYKKDRLIRYIIYFLLYLIDIFG